MLICVSSFGYINFIIKNAEATVSAGLRAQRECADVLAPYFEQGGLVMRVLDNASTRPHIMDFTRLRVLTAMFSLVNKVCLI